MHSNHTKAARPVRVLQSLYHGLRERGGAFCDVLGDGIAVLRDPARRKQKIISFVLFCTAVAILFSAIRFWTPMTRALEVKYDGQTIGYVSDESALDTACSVINDRIADNGAALETETRETIVDSSSVQTADDLTQNLLKAASSNIAEACGLYIDGNLVTVVAKRAQLQAALDVLLVTQQTGAGLPSFLNDVVLKDALYPVESIAATADSEKLAALLQVCTVTTVITSEDVAFASVVTEDASKAKGVVTVVQPGAAGKKMVVTQIKTVNGIESERAVVSETLLKQPVAEQKTVGTYVAPQSNSTVTSAAQFLWPVAKAPNSYISAYWGDNRGHKGIDICAPGGTSIYAANAGTVTYAGWGSDYGLYVIIDHGNGFSTLYGHCSSLSVSVGQTVVRGQYIAAVGQTGNATGTHLHFEVRVNGERQNPAPYLGL